VGQRRTAPREPQAGLLNQVGLEAIRMSVERVLPDPGVAESASEESVARIASRLSAEYVLRTFQLLIDTHGDVRAGLLVGAINAANVSYIDALTAEGQRAAVSDGFVRDDMRRPISIDRLADSAGLPRESTRRIVQGLIDAGYCICIDGGVISPRASMARPENVRLATANVHSVREFVRKLLAFGLVEETLSEAPAWQVTVRPAAVAPVVARLSTDYLLRALQLLVETYGDIRAGVIAHAIVTANTAHLDGPMGEGWRYAGIDQPPPDAVRRPVSVSELARSLGLPYETLRRQARRLIDTGVCLRVEGGLIVPMAFLEQPGAARAMLATIRHVRVFVRYLRALGIDPNEP
jgi:DNA-binding Lrp family transcriptional regulator